MAEAKSTEDQWYKAAYYKGGSTNAGYWDYADGKAWCAPRRQEHATHQPVISQAILADVPLTGLSSCASPGLTHRRSICTFHVYRKEARCSASA